MKFIGSESSVGFLMNKSMLEGDPKDWRDRPLLSWLDVCSLVGIQMSVLGFSWS